MCVLENISKALNSQFTSAKEVVRKVESIAKSTEENNRTEQKTAALSQKLAGLSNVLSQLIVRFQVG